MRRYVVGFFAVVGVLVVLLIVAGVVAWRALVPREPTIASSTILSLDLGKSLAESAPSDPFTRYLLEETVSLRDVLDALQRAGDDSRVKGVFARLGAGEMGTAMMQERRAAIAAGRSWAPSSTADPTRRARRTSSTSSIISAIATRRSPPRAPAPAASPRCSARCPISTAPGGPTATARPSP